jgi:hypothetical protein
VVNFGSNASFTVAVTGNPTPTLQWFISTDAGATWAQLSNNGTYSNVTSATLGVTTPAVSMTGYLYRCLASNSVQNNVPSVSASLTVNPVYSITVVNGAVGSPGVTTLTGLTTGTVVEIHANPAPNGQMFTRWTASDSGPFGEVYNNDTTFTIGTQNVTISGSYDSLAFDSADHDSNVLAMTPAYFPPSAGSASTGTGSANASYTVIEYYPEIDPNCWWDYVIVDWEYDYYSEQWVPIWDWVEYCDPIVLFYWETDLFQVSNTVDGLSYTLTLNFANGTSTTFPFIGNGGTKNVVAYKFGSGADPAPTSATAERTTQLTITGRDGICTDCFAYFLVKVIPAAQVYVTLSAADLPQAATGQTDSNGEITLALSWSTPGVRTVTAKIDNTSISVSRNIQVIGKEAPPYTSAWNQIDFIGKVISAHTQTAADNPDLLGNTKASLDFVPFCNCTCAGGAFIADPHQFVFSGRVRITDYWYRSDVPTRNGVGQGGIDYTAIVGAEAQHYEDFRTWATTVRNTLSNYNLGAQPFASCRANMDTALQVWNNAEEAYLNSKNALDKNTKPYGPHPKIATQILRKGGFKGLNYYRDEDLERP